MDRTADGDVLYKDSASTCLGEEPQESQRIVPLPGIESSIREIHDTENPTAYLDTTQDTPGGQWTKLDHESAPDMQVDPTIRETTQTAQTIPHHNPLGDENNDDNRHGPHVHLDRLVAIIDIEEHATKIIRKP